MHPLRKCDGFQLDTVQESFAGDAGNVFGDPYGAEFLAVAECFLANEDHTVRDLNGLKRTAPKSIIRDDLQCIGKLDGPMLITAIKCFSGDHFYAGRDRDGFQVG